MKEPRDILLGPAPRFSEEKKESAKHRMIRLRVAEIIQEIFAGFNPSNSSLIISEIPDKNRRLKRVLNQATKDLGVETTGLTFAEVITETTGKSIEELYE